MLPTQLQAHGQVVIKRGSECVAARGAEEGGGGDGDRDAVGRGPGGEAEWGMGILDFLFASKGAI